MWCSLGEIFLSLLFTVSYQITSPDPKQMLDCFLNRQYFCNQCPDVLSPSALKAPPSITLTPIIHGCLTWMPPGPLKPLYPLSIAPQGHRTSSVFASLASFSLGGLVICLFVLFCFRRFYLFESESRRDHRALEREKQTRH